MSSLSSLSPCPLVLFVSCLLTSIKWELEKWQPNHVWNKDYFYGQSISQLQELCTEQDYGIVNLEYNNAFLVPQEISRMPILAPEEAFKKGYLERTDRQEKFLWNAEIEEIYSLSPQAALNFINKMFKKYKFNILILFES